MTDFLNRCSCCGLPTSPGPCACYVPHAGDRAKVHEAVDRAWLAIMAQVKNEPIAVEIDPDVPGRVIVSIPDMAAPHIQRVPEFRITVPASRMLLDKDHPDAVWNDDRQLWLESDAAMCKRIKDSL